MDTKPIRCLDVDNFAQTCKNMVSFNRGKNMKSNYLLKHSLALSRKHAGKHVAMVDDKVVAIGKSGLEVYRKAIKDIPKNKTVGIYYLPTKREILTAL